MPLGRRVLMAAIGTALVALIIGGVLLVTGGQEGRGRTNSGVVVITPVASRYPAEHRAAVTFSGRSGDEFYTAIVFNGDVREINRTRIGMWSREGDGGRLVSKRTPEDVLRDRCPFYLKEREVSLQPGNLVLLCSHVDQYDQHWETWVGMVPSGGASDRALARAIRQQERPDGGEQDE